MLKILRRERSLLLRAVSATLVLLLGLVITVWPNGGEEKTAKEWLEEFYGEPFDEPPGKEPPERAPEGSLEAKLEMDHAPRPGDTARITLSVASHWDFPRVKIGIGVARVRDVDRPPGIEIVSWPEGFEVETIPRGDMYCMMISRLNKDERRVFHFVIKATSKGTKWIGGGVGEMAPLERRVMAGDNLYLDVGKDQTKVSKSPFPPPPEFWATPLIQGTGPMMDLKLMREGMEAFMKEAPGLTRWEARWLMDKVEHSVVIEGIPYEEQIRKALRKVLEEGRHLARKREIDKLEAFRIMVEEWKKNRPTYRWVDPTGREFDEKGRLRETE